jgi:hypothetical protein
VTTLRPHDTDEPQDDYKGGVGWVIVAEGINGVAVLLDYDPDFGALRYMLDSSLSGSSLEELGFDCDPGEPGVFKATFSTWTTSMHDYDGADNDMGFNLVGEWETIWEPEEDSDES